MNNSLPRILTLLRKEKRLTQLEAANILGVSQALLSHYENGRRECGLDFLVAAADYYNVSCDYLLGRTTERYDSSAHSDKDVKNPKEAFSSNRRMIVNSVRMVIIMLNEIENEQLTDDILSYIMASLYKVLRIIHTTNLKNPKDMFAVNAMLYNAASNSMMNMCEAKGLLTARSIRKTDAAQMISPESMLSSHPVLAPSLISLVDQVEKSLLSYT